jgi:hypothetical protein
LIVFSIVFGEAYIRKAADFGLASLLASGNLPSLGEEKPELHIFTIARDVRLVETLIVEKPEIAAFFAGRVRVSSLDEVAAGMELPRHKADVTGNLMCHIVKMCIKRDRSFLFAVPDIVYSNGSIETCWQLHRMTGKVVSIFNGRVLPKDGEPPFSPEMMTQWTRPHGVRDFFFSHMNGTWHKSMTTDPDVVPDHARRGHLIFRRDRFSFVFSRPNPVIGRFTERDLMLFASGGNIKSWDHEWQDRLMAEGRLQVQTNLDLGMSIELDDGFYRPDETIRPLLDMFGSKDLALRRENKFAFSYASMAFSTQHR